MSNVLNSAGQNIVTAINNLTTVFAGKPFIKTSVLTTRGDIITEGSSAPQRLGLGAQGYVFQSNGTDPIWAPFIALNVNDFGATGDGSTDDYTAIQNTINAASSAGRLGVYFPPGNYAVGTGLSVSGTGAKLFGCSGGTNGAPTIRAKNNADIRVIRLSGFASSLEGLNIQGGGLGSTQSTIEMVGVESTIYNCRITGGAQCIKISGPDVIIFDIHAESAYANAVVSFQGGSGYLYRCKLDQNFPTGVTPSGLPSAWQVTHLYTANTCVSIGSGSYYLQCTVGGTSGGSEPAAANYGTNITDGSVTWRLVGPVDYTSLKYDNTGSCVAHGCDHTGPYTNGILLSDDGSHGGPQSIVIRDAVIGNYWSNGIFLRGASAAGNEISGCLIQNAIDGTNGRGIYLDASTGGDTSVTDNLIYNQPKGVDIAAGNNHTVCNNKIFGCTIGVNVAANVNNFTICNNVCGSSSTWGANTTAIKVQVGTSDHYVIANNIVNGAGTGVSDGGGGANKTVSANE